MSTGNFNHIGSIMKNIYRLASASLIFCVSTVYSATGEVPGEVLKIRSHDTSVGIDNDWVMIDASSAGSCRKVSGKVVFSLKNDDKGKRHLSILLSAKMANKQVTIGYDDVALNSYYCSIRYIDI
jgi:hypothetical protein